MSKLSRMKHANVIDAMNPFVESVVHKQVPEESCSML